MAGEEDGVGEITPAISRTGRPITSFTLIEKQQLFPLLLAKLIFYIYARGWSITLGEGFDDDGKGHMPGSLHYTRLAQDINLFVDNVYIKTQTKEYEDLGKFWKNLHPLCAWGGDFSDANHFSLTDKGKK